MTKVAVAIAEPRDTDRPLCCLQLRFRPPDSFLLTSCAIRHAETEAADPAKTTWTLTGRKRTMASVVPPDARSLSPAGLLRLQPFGCECLIGGRGN